MKKVLVIGDGQLGLMMAEAAARLGIVLDRVSPERGELFRGTGRMPELLAQGWCAEEYDVVTAEREHLPDNALLDRLREHPGFGAASAIEQIADRRTQKALLDELGIATACWATPRGRDDIGAFLRLHAPRAIVKAARGGYDGRGQWRVGRGADAPDPALHPQGLIIERAVAFARELSLVGARFANGRQLFYPLVQNHHADGMLRCTLAPATVSPAQQQRARAMLGTVMESLGYVGVMAMELFDEAGELLVNELAPRVHNSGYWTLAGAGVDQFDLHLRALCELPCVEPAHAGCTVMLNLVGTGFDPRWLAQPGARLHWYGKEPAPGRKLGHLNLHAPDAEQLGRVVGALLPMLDDAHGQGARHALALLQQDSPGGVPEHANRLIAFRVKNKVRFAI